MSRGRLLRSAFVVGVGATLFFASATTSWAATQPQSTKPESAATITDLPKVKKPSGEDRADKASQASERESAKQGKGKKSKRPIDNSTSSSLG